MRKNKIILTAVLSVLGVGALVGGAVVAGKLINGTDTSSSQVDENYRPDVSGLTLPSQSVKFDGKPHSLKVEGNVPTSCHIEYEGNSVVDIGRYTVTANVYYDGKEEPIKLTTLTGNLEIYLNEVDYDFITPNINEISLSENGISLSQTTVTFNIEISNLFFPEDLSLEFDYGIFNESSSNISVKNTFLYGNSYLFEVTTPRLASDVNTFTLSKINYRYGLSYDINQSINFTLEKEFSVRWTEDENSIFATIDNSYHQSPSKFVFLVDGESVERTVGGNMSDYSVAFDKKDDGETHTLELSKIIFNPTGYTSEFILNSQFSYYKEAPISYFGDKVSVEELENYEFATSTNITILIERNNSENEAHIQKLHYTVGDDEFETNIISQEFYVVGPTEYYKFSATLPNIYGGLSLKVLGITTEEDGFHLLNKQVTVNKKDFEISTNFVANYDYNTNKTTLVSTIDNDYAEFLTPTTIKVNNEELNYNASLTLDGYFEEITIQEITFSHSNGTYKKAINETIVPSEDETIVGLDVVNNHYGYMFQVEKVKIMAYGTNFDLNSVVSVTIVENEVETTLTEGFELIEGNIFSIPYNIEYGNHPTFSIISFVYGNSEKHYEVVTGVPFEYSFEEKSLVEINGTSVEQENKKFFVEFECESSVEIDYIVASVYVDGALVEDDGIFDATVENPNIDLYSFILSGLDYGGNILEHNVTIEISRIRAYYNESPQILYLSTPYVIVYNQL